MSAVHEIYPLTPPHKIAAESPDSPAIPDEAFGTHSVVYVYDAITGVRASIPPRSYALAEAGYAKRLVDAGKARHEKPNERELAISNGHQRERRPATKAKEAKPAKARKADGDGDS